MSKPIGWECFAPLATRIAAAAVLLAIAVCLVPSPAGAQTNLLLNPDLSAGSGDAPQYWYHDAYTGNPGDVEFQWIKDTDPASLEVFNYQPRDSRWMQKVHLKPGWYHFTASVRTENVGVTDTGANISIMESWILSRNVTGTGYWEPIGFYLQVPKETDVVFACRLGFYSSQNTGRAFFRDMRVVPVAAPAKDGDPAFKLETWTKPAPATK